MSGKTHEERFLAVTTDLVDDTKVVAESISDGCQGINTELSQ